MKTRRSSRRAPRLRVVFGRIVTAAVPLAALHCGSDPAVLPAVDAGIADAGAFDAGLSDGGPLDAGHDGGTPDSGVDGGPIDGGTDAGPVDAGEPCQTGWTAPLPEPLPDGGIQQACEQVCGGPPLVWHCSIDTTQDPPVLCLGCAAIGRRPAGLRRGVVRAASRVGAMLAEAAALEASSVPAFRTLARELRWHGAPRRLVSAARRSAREERRHTRAMTALARRYGGVVPPTTVEPLPARALEAIAEENAVEGCVRETWGALCATWQARNAGDPVVRQTLLRIADDETRHAELSWSVARWAEPRLSPDARERLRRARRREWEVLYASATEPGSLEEQAALGLPPPEVARAMLREMANALGI